VTEVGIMVWQDWDWENTPLQEYIDLVTEVAVSPFCSMKVIAGGRWKFSIKADIVPIVQVKEGMVVTWVRFTDTSKALLVVFRYQDANNYYYARFASGASGCYLGRVKAGAGKTFKAGTWSPDADTWYRIRARWWYDPGWGLEAWLEVWDGDAWQTVVQYSEDPDNEWADVGGRVGFEVESPYHYLDDILILGSWFGPLFVEPWSD